jgi:hypothetical protein
VYQAVVQVLSRKWAKKLALEAYIDLIKSAKNTVDPKVGKSCTLDYDMEDVFPFVIW